MDSIAQGMSAAIKPGMNAVSPKGTILLVEDDPDDVFIFQRALVAANVLNPVVVVTDGQAAVEYLSHQGEYADPKKYPRPFVIFLDLKLPYLDGFEVLTWIRKQPYLESVVVVVLSGSDENRDHQRAYALGARSYLVKPPSGDEIREFMDSMVSYWGGSAGN